MKTFPMITAVMMSLIVASCGSKEPSALIAQSERINGELSELAENSPMFLSEASANYTDGKLNINVALSDTIIDADDLSDALLQFVVAQYMQNHTGSNLDETLNTLGKEKGSLTLTVTDSDGDKKTIDLSSATLKRLVTAKPMDLRVSEVRSNVIDIMDERCDQLEDAVNAKECEFKYASSFAQYTFTFASPQAFVNLNSSTLAGRYKKAIDEIYTNYGACRPMVQDMLEELEIDGYRIIYTSGNKNLKTSLPWRLLN